MEQENRLEDVFEQMSEIHQDFPETQQNAVWYGQKLHEEVAEFQQVAHNEPNGRQWQEQVEELSDVFITLIGAYLDLGVAPQIALMFVQAKLIEVRERFASGWYKDRPQLKVPETTIYTPPFFDDLPE